MPNTRKQQLKELSDAELLAQYKENEQSAYIGELFERYTHLVYAVSMKYLKNEEDSRDASMQIFEKLFEDIKKHEIANFKGWLGMVTKNYCLMQLRSAKGRVHREVKEFEETDGGIVQMDHSLHLNGEESKENQLNRLEYCITQLKDEQKVCIELFYIHQKCYQEITESTKYDLKKVKSYIQNGKRNLKICMTDNGRA